VDLSWKFSQGKKIKLIRKDSDPSYLRVGQVTLTAFLNTFIKIELLTIQTDHFLFKIVKNGLR
jgi:hypothetical protein